MSDRGGDRDMRTAETPGAPGASGVVASVGGAAGGLEVPVPAGSDERRPDVEEIVVPVFAERLRVSKRRVQERVRVVTRTREREHLVDEEVAQERVEVERVPVGRVVDAVPPVREEGDTTVLPVVVEEVVVVRRLVLKEEIRIRRLRSTGRHRETVVLREQDAVITRDPAGEAAGDSPAPTDKTA